MDASYLRIKNWGELQHYSNRRPAWIKVYPRLLEDDAFARLDELLQWQLMRIWFVASRSTALTVDEDGKEVPVVANDAAALQRAIHSLKKVPLARLIREGWLIPVSEDELIAPAKARPARVVASAPLATGDAVVEHGDARSERSSIVHSAPVDEPDEPRNDAASTPNLASTPLAAGLHDASASLSSRGLEGLELASLPGRNSETLGPELADAIDRARTATEHQESLPVEIEFQVARLLRRIGDHADNGSDGHPPTAQVVRSLARRSTQASLGKVIESLENSQPGDRAAYAVAALRSEIEERKVA